MNKHILMKILMLILSVNVIGQETDSIFYCANHSGYFGLEPQIYLFENQDTIKIIDNTYPNIINIHLEDEFPFSEDTITIKKTLNNLLNSHQEKILISDFEDINFDTNKVILYSKHVNFIGDHLIDKIELVPYSNKYIKEDSYQIRLYENINGELFNHDLCNMTIQTKPIKIYITKVRRLNMSSIILLNQGKIPDESFEFVIFYADRYEVISK